MKAIQITVDDDLLLEFDRQDEVTRLGRSATIRRLLAAWLAERREAELIADYRRAYSATGGLDDEWKGWEDQGEWAER